jgi:hypothetical protein
MWTKERQASETEFAALNLHLTPEEAKRIFRQLSMGMLPDTSRKNRFAKE